MEIKRGKKMEHHNGATMNKMRAQQNQNKIVNSLELKGTK